MATVSISEFKANLSRYIRAVRRGGEIQILRRGTPVAKLVPVVKDNQHDVRERLIRYGILKPGQGNTATVLDKPPLVLPTSIREPLADERDDRFRGAELKSFRVLP